MRHVRGSYLMVGLIKPVCSLCRRLLSHSVKKSPRGFRREGGVVQTESLLRLRYHLLCEKERNPPPTVCRDHCPGAVVTSSGLRCSQSSWCRHRHSVVRTLGGRGRAGVFTIRPSRTKYQLPNTSCHLPAVACCVTYDVLDPYPPRRQRFGMALLPVHRARTRTLPWWRLETHPAKRCSAEWSSSAYF